MGLLDGRERDVVDRYERGETIEAIARALGVSAKPVRSVLEAAGVAFRPPGRPWPLADEEGAIAAAYAAGETLASLAHRYSVSQRTVRKAVLAGGGRLRPPGGRPRPT
ncbi:MAG TPA: hypothetical protein VNU26_17060 [Mycobacteriales bacterium]|nr:hypothetical protein [Mycobacteriales bacterium]